MKNAFSKTGIILLLLGFFNTSYSQPADTIKTSLPQAEELFLKNNLQLLAQKFNIDAQKAFIIQAKLYPNPTFYFEQSAYNPTSHTWFDLGANGEQILQVQQLVLLAHKINKQVKIAETSAKISEYNFYDLLRTLKYTLRNDFYTIYFLQRSEAVYGQEISSLEKVSKAFEEQRDKGYIARTEVVRIKAQLYSLQSELNDLRNQIKDAESELRLILQVSPKSYLIPSLDSSEILAQNPRQFKFESLIDSAYQNRSDLMIAKANLTLSQQNYDYQKALATPDLTFGANYDKAGSFVNNYNGISMGFSIPIFNRNQGNIKAYKSLISATDAQLQSTQKQVEEQVYRGLEMAIDADKLYQGMDKNFTGEFSQLSQSVYDNYVKRNVSLLDFLNFYDSYKQYMVQMNNILLNRTSALENINYLTGTNFFNK